MKNLIGPLAIATLALFACSKSDKTEAPAPGVSASTTGAASFKASCNKKNKTSKCDEYQSETLGLEEGACKELGGVYGKTACPTEDRLGTCKKKTGDTYYYATNAELTYTAATAKEDCEDPITEGKFIAATSAAPATTAAATGAAGSSCDKLAAELCAGEPAKCAARKAWLDKTTSKGRKGEPIPDSVREQACKGVLDNADALAGYKTASKKAVK